MSDDIPAIIAGLSAAQREAHWYGTGHKRLKNVIIELSDAGLVEIIPMAGGWAWRPTATGKAVRDALIERAAK